MGRPSLSPATKRAVIEAAVEFVKQKGKATPKEVANALNGRFGAGPGVKLTAMRLGKILQGEDRIEQRYSRGHRSYYVLAGVGS